MVTPEVYITHNAASSDDPQPQKGCVIHVIGMDWFHCNSCFRQQGQNLNFAVSSCGHICCEGCINPKHCNVCGASCNYLPISDQMKPQEQVFFKDPVKLIQSRLDHIAQIALFQRRQKERVLVYFKNKSQELERRLKDVTQQCYRQVLEIKKENAELKKPLSQRRVSPGQFKTNGNTQRMSLPVAVTSPVTPRNRNIRQTGCAEPQERYRDGVPRLSIISPPGSATSLSSLSSFQEQIFRTPSSISTPTRSEPLTPNVFQFQLFSGSSLQSPRPLRTSHFNASGMIN